MAKGCFRNHFFLTLYGSSSQPTANPEDDDLSDDSADITPTPSLAPSEVGSDNGSRLSRSSSFSSEASTAASETLPPTIPDLYNSLLNNSDSTSAPTYIQFFINSIPCDPETLENLQTGIFEIRVASDSVEGVLSPLQVAVSICLQLAMQGYLSSLNLLRLETLVNPSPTEVAAVLGNVKRAAGVVTRRVAMKGEGVAERVKEEFRSAPSFKDTIEIDENMKYKMANGEVIVYRLMPDSFEVKVFHQSGHEAASETSHEVRKFELQKTLKRQCRVGKSSSSPVAYRLHIRLPLCCCLALLVAECFDHKGCNHPLPPSAVLRRTQLDTYCQRRYDPPRGLPGPGRVRRDAGACTGGR